MCDHAASPPQLKMSGDLPYSVNGNSIQPVVQVRPLELSLTLFLSPTLFILFSVYHVVGSIFETHPESDLSSLL